MGNSIALTELTMLKYQRMDVCAAIQRRSAWRPPYALTTALELLSVEMPRIPHRHRRITQSVMVAVPHANAKRHVEGLAAAVWPFPIDTIIVDGQFVCTSAPCTWAMFSSYLGLEELVVLADSMMRRDKRLRRTTTDDLTLYLDNAYRRVQESKATGAGTRLVPPRYGLDMPQVNYPIFAGRSAKPLYLDLAYPEFKICIEYEGSHHAGQWLNDVRRRQTIEDAQWKYIQVTKLDLGHEDDEEAFARRIAEKMHEVTGKAIQLTPRKTIRQICDARTVKRAPLYERLNFTPLLPANPMIR